MKNNKIVSDWPSKCAMQLQIGCCTSCGACVAACRPGVWFRDDDGQVKVYIDGNCTCCGECEAACPEGVIHIVAT